jgi:ATP-dependent Lhr-like helicase
LYKEGYIEPPPINDKPYDILLHQILSIVKSTSGISYNELLLQAHKNFAFGQIDIEEIREIIDHLIKIDFLEKIQNELIIGTEGEQLVNSRHFYSVFKTEENFKVVHQGHTIGEIPFSLQIIEGENILLAAKMWKIKFVDERAKRIEVAIANDGKKPMFFGSGITIHSKIRQRMIELLYSDQQFDFLDESATNAINEMRKDFSSFQIQNIQTDRPLLVGEKYLELYSFTGTRVNRSLSFLLNSAGVKNKADEQSSMLDIEAGRHQLLSTLSKIRDINIEVELEKLVVSNPAVLDF